MCSFTRLNLFPGRVCEEIWFNESTNRIPNLYEPSSPYNILEITPTRVYRQFDLIDSSLLQNGLSFARGF
jgi:hypothetical protein